MSEYIVSCCSTADLSKEHLDRMGVPYASFSYFIDGKEYEDDLFETLSPDDFYRQIDEGAQPTTTQVAPDTYERLWEKYLKEGKDILHLALSSGISGTYQSAVIAKNTLASKYPQRKIDVVDSLVASSGFGLLAAEVKERADRGISLEDNVKWINENKTKLHHWFFSTDLTSYIRGGRISKVSGFFGTKLSICPLMNVNVEGKLIPREKIRTKKKVIQRTFEKMKEHAQNGADYTGKVYISNSNCYEDALELADLIRGYFKSLKEDVTINNIGPVIGSHTGPGTVALFFWGDERTI